MSGYCTAEDVRRALQDVDLEGETAVEFAQDAIEGQTEWLRKRTGRHWYDSTVSGLFDGVESYGEDVLDVPSTPHPGPAVLRHHDQRNYPKRTAGPYTSVTLTKRDVSSLTSLDIRDPSGGTTDWVADSRFASGRGEDYYLQVDPSSGQSVVYLHAGSLPAMWNYSSAVIASYDYGQDGVPETIRRAVAMRAAADLVMDDDGDVGVPDSGQLVSVQSKADQLREQADDLLSPWMHTPIA